MLFRGHLRDAPRRPRVLRGTLSVSRRAPSDELVFEEPVAVQRPAVLSALDRARLAELVGSPLGRGVIMASALVMTLLNLGRRRRGEEPGGGPD